MSEDQLDASGSEQALPGIPFSVAAGSTKNRGGPGSQPKHGANAAKERHPAPRKACGVTPHKGKLRIRPGMESNPASLHGFARLHTLPPEHYLISKVHWPSPGPNNGSSHFYSSSLHKIIEWGKCLTVDGCTAQFATLISSHHT